MTIPALNKLALCWAGSVLLGCATMPTRLNASIVNASIVNASIVNASIVNAPREQAAQYVAKHRTAMLHEALDGHGEHLRQLAAMGQCSNEYDVALSLSNRRNRVPVGENESSVTNIEAARSTVAILADASELHCDAWQKNARRRGASSKTCYPRERMARGFSLDSSYRFPRWGARPHYSLLGTMKCQ